MESWLSHSQFVNVIPPHTMQNLQPLESNSKVLILNNAQYQILNIENRIWVQLHCAITSPLQSIYRKAKMLKSAVLIS